MPLATPTDLPRDFMDTMVAMVVMDTVAIMARGMLRLSLGMAMPLATPTDLPRDFMDTMVAMGVMDTVAIMARGMLRLSLDMALALLPTILMAAPALSTG